MQFVEIAFPLLVTIGSSAPDEIESMAKGFERYFERGERYALISWAPPGVAMPDAKQRKRIADWANEPRVREISARLCVGSTVVVDSALTRGVMTALMWLWKPASPLELASSPREAIDWCLDRLAAADVVMLKSRPQIHEMLTREVFGVAKAKRSGR